MQYLNLYLYCRSKLIKVSYNLVNLQVKIRWYLLAETQYSTSDIVIVCMCELLCPIVLCTEVLYSSRKAMVYVAPNSSLLDAFCALHGNAIHRLLVVDVLRHNPLYTITHLLLLRFIYAKV